MAVLELDLIVEELVSLVDLVVAAVALLVLRRLAVGVEVVAEEPVLVVVVHSETVTGSEAFGELEHLVYVVTVFLMVPVAQLIPVLVVAM